MQKITIALLGRRLNAAAGETLVSQQKANRYRDAFLFNLDQGEAWLFDYGALICWNLGETERHRLCNALAEFIEEPIDRPAIEHYSYQHDEEKPFNIHHDLIRLPDNDKLIRLALSHAFAQSAKLDFFEDQAQRVIQENSYISKQLAASGKIPLSRRELAKLRGVLFDTSSDITLHFNLLDTPEFFWDYPELEEYYHTLAKYLDLNARIEILNKKLTTIHELLDMLAAEQHHKHSAFLEWIIIILIAVDILIYFLPK